MSNRTRLYRG